MIVYTMKVLAAISIRVNGCQMMVFQTWAHGQVPLNLQWLVLIIRIAGGADFLQCWVANFIWLEHAESL